MSGEKTEAPTEEKLRKSREKGELPARKNVLEAFLLTGGFALIIGLSATLHEGISAVFEASLSGLDMSFSAALGRARDAAMGVVQLIAGLALACGLTVLLMNLLLNKFNFAPKAMEPKFEKLNPVTGFKNIFSISTLYNFIRLLFLFTTISLIGYLIIRGNIVDGVDAAACGVTCLAVLFPPIIMQMVILILTVVIIFAAIDFKIQNALFTKQQKMTKDEVKKESKNSEGDPQIKGNRTAIGEENIYLPTMKEVTHVVYSNTVLVALMARKGEAPIVVMKSKGTNVARLQLKFRAMGKKCVNLPEIAAQLHPKAKIGQYLEGKDAAKGWFKVLAHAGEF